MAENHRPPSWASRFCVNALGGSSESEAFKGGLISMQERSKGSAWQKNSSPQKYNSIRRGAAPQSQFFRCSDSQCLHAAQFWQGAEGSGGRRPSDQAQSQFPDLGNSVPEVGDGRYEDVIRIQSRQPEDQWNQDAIVYLGINSDLGRGFRSSGRKLLEPDMSL